jgi:hypothetical protein
MRIVFTVTVVIVVLGTAYCIAVGRDDIGTESDEQQKTGRYAEADQSKPVGSAHTSTGVEG